MLKTIFRYPGGKNKISKDIIMDILPHEPKRFIDVFVGGGSISIEVLNNIAVPIVVNDLDPYIYSFWNTLCNDANGLVDRIKREGNPTIEKFNEYREYLLKDNSLEDKAFYAVFFNRTTFSGIFKSGPIGGYDQKGKYKIDCRYNVNKIIKSIQVISESLINSKCVATNKDFREVLNDYNDSDNFIYLDPPYMRQGNQLYPISMCHQDFVDMANILKKTNCKWIISHDNYDPFIDLYRGWANITDTKSIPYTINSIKDKAKQEILISNFDFDFNKRKKGRPLSTNNIYSVNCCICSETFKTNPSQMEKYSLNNKINIDKLKFEYKCRNCRKS